METRLDAPPIMIPLIYLEELSFSSKKTCVIRDINQKCLNKDGEWEHCQSSVLWNDEIGKRFRFKSTKDAIKFWNDYEDKKR